VALPTRAQIRTTILAWWQAPGRPRLARLRALLAAMINTNVDPGVGIQVGIVNLPPLTLVIRATQTDVDGNQTVLNTLTYDATDIPPNAQNIDFDDIIDDDTGKLTRRQRANNQNSQSQRVGN